MRAQANRRFRRGIGPAVFLLGWPVALIFGVHALLVWAVVCAFLLGHWWARQSFERDDGYNIEP